MPLPLLWVCILTCSHVLYCHYRTSVIIRHSNRSLMLSFCISAMVLTLTKDNYRKNTLQDKFELLSLSVFNKISIHSKRSFLNSLSMSFSFAALGFWWKCGNLVWISSMVRSTSFLHALLRLPTPWWTQVWLEFNLWGSSSLTPYLLMR